MQKITPKTYKERTYVPYYIGFLYERQIDCLHVFVQSAVFCIFIIANHNLNSADWYDTIDKKECAV